MASTSPTGALIGTIGDWFMSGNDPTGSASYARALDAVNTAENEGRLDHDSAVSWRSDLADAYARVDTLTMAGIAEKARTATGSGFDSRTVGDEVRDVVRSVTPDVSFEWPEIPVGVWAIGLLLVAVAVRYVVGSK